MAVKAPFNGTSSLLEFLDPQFALKDHQGVSFQIDLAESPALRPEIDVQDFAAPGRVGVHAREARLSNRIAFVVPPQEKILGICTSSATVGSSISFGIADAVTLFSHDVALADAWATSVCNQIRPDDQTILDKVNPDEIMGVFAIMGDSMVKWGHLPPLVSAVIDEQLISAGDRI